MPLTRNRTTWTNIKPIDPVYDRALHYLMAVTLPQVSEIPQKIDEAFRLRRLGQVQPSQGDDNG